MSDTKIAKVDSKFYTKMRDIMRVRYDKKLCNFTAKEMGMPEATRLALRAPSWPKVEKELLTLPKKEGIILKNILEKPKEDV